MDTVSVHEDLVSERGEELKLFCDFYCVAGVVAQFRHQDQGAEWLMALPVPKFANLSSGRLSSDFLLQSLVRNAVMDCT